MTRHFDASNQLLRDFKCVVASTWVSCETQKNFNTWQEWEAKGLHHGCSGSEMLHVAYDKGKAEGGRPLPSVGQG